MTWPGFPSRCHRRSTVMPPENGESCSSIVVGFAFVGMSNTRMPFTVLPGLISFREDAVADVGDAGADLRDGEGELAVLHLVTEPGSRLRLLGRLRLRGVRGGRRRQVSRAAARDGVQQRAVDDGGEDHRGEPDDRQDEPAGRGALVGGAAALGALATGRAGHDTDDRRDVCAEADDGIQDPTTDRMPMTRLVVPSPFLGIGWAGGTGGWVCCVGTDMTLVPPLGPEASARKRARSTLVT